MQPRPAAGLPHRKAPLVVLCARYALILCGLAIVAVLTSTALLHSSFSATPPRGGLGSYTPGVFVRGSRQLEEASGSKQEAVESADARHEIRCRNTVQGRSLLTDDRGFVCSREHLNASGCCTRGVRYACSAPTAADVVREPGGALGGVDGGVLPAGVLGCQKRFSCCHEFETCVSCCLGQPLNFLETVWAAMQQRSPLLFGGELDSFELCSRRCRTSSESVVHENAYRSRTLKHCYALEEPPLQPE